MFIRDPLVIYSERVQLDDDTETDHFENIQSTNWQTVRWKPPPPKAPLTGDSHIGWRTEFRSMEVQLTDFENAAFTVFVVLVSRVILYFNLNFYMPLSAVDANMRKAHVRDAINTQKFCFRQSPGPVANGEAEPDLFKRPHPRAPLLSDEVRHATSSCCGGTEGVQEFTLHEIMAGKDSFKGLVPFILTYLELIKTDTATMKTITNYLDFIVARASGELMTPATWMRKFVREHPDYKGDSIISQKVAADLLSKCHRIGLGLEHVPELHGDFLMAPIQTKDAYAVDMGESRRRHSVSLDNTQALMAMHQMRIQMQARRRKLAAGHFAQGAGGGGARELVCGRASSGWPDQCAPRRSLKTLGQGLGADGPNPRLITSRRQSSCACPGHELVKKYLSPCPPTPSPNPHCRRAAASWPQKRQNT